MLKKWIALFLMCWLPLQAVHALAVVHCPPGNGAGQHTAHGEGAAAAVLPGAQVDAGVDGENPVPDLGSVVAMDAACGECAQCHAACACALLSLSTLHLDASGGAPRVHGAVPPQATEPGTLERVPLGGLTSFV